MGKKTVFFITGTDTGVGKTLVACALLAAANNKGLSTLGLKPLAAGCEETPDGLRNEDALALQTTSSVKLPYEQVNPVALKLSMAPHIAAAREGKRPSIDRLAGFCRGVAYGKADFCVVEGAGGWRVPISQVERFSALPKQLGIPVILVVGMRLGCLNHALLTAEAILRDGLQLAGWVASSIEEDMPALEENIGTLKMLLPCPCLGVIPWLGSSDAEDTTSKVLHAASFLNIAALPGMSL